MFILTLFLIGTLTGAELFRSFFKSGELTSLLKLDYGGMIELFISPSKSSPSKFDFTGYFVIFGISNPI